MHRTNRDVSRVFRWILILGLAIPASAMADWPAYQHDAARSGYSDETALRLPAERVWTHRASHPPRPAWTPPARGSYWQRLTHIEPRVADDHAFFPVIAGPFVLYGSSADDHLHCLDAETGRVRWSFCTDGPVRFAPFVAGEQVIAGSDDGWIYCVNLADGGLIWKRHLPPEDRRIPANGRIVSAWPIRTGIVVRDNVAFTIAGLLDSEGVHAGAIDLVSGNWLWKERVPASAQGYLLASTDQLFVPTGRGSPVSLDRFTGRVTKQFKSGGGTHAVVTENQLVSGPGINGQLTFADRVSAERLVHFAGRHMVVSPRFSYLLGDELMALDRVRYFELLGRSRALSAEIAEDQRRLKQMEASAAGAADVASVRQTLSDKGIELDRIKRSLASCVTWTRNVDTRSCLIGIGDRLFAGGLDGVKAFDMNTGEPVWEAAVPGRVLGLAATSRRLVVSTDRGEIHCFKSDTADGRSRPDLAAAPTSTAPRLADSGDDTAGTGAKRIAGAIASGADRTPRKGYALVLGAADQGRLALELVNRCGYQVLAIDTDSGRVRAAREFLMSSGMYGDRISVHAVEANAAIPFTDYFANIIVSTRDTLGDRSIPWKRTELIRCLRPFGGELWTAGEPSPEIRGALSGAGAWTHQFANSANTSSSGDRLIQRNLKLQWIGGPGPDQMVDRHLRAPPPLSESGILIVAGENSLNGVDAYNGTELWRVALPNSQRYSMPYDAGYMSLDGGRVAVADRGECRVLDAATGSELSVWRVPNVEGIEEPHWGYTLLQGDSVIGTVQRSTASRTDASFDRINVDYRNEQPVVTGNAVFKMNVDDGKLLWKRDRPRIINPTLTVHGGHVYFVAGGRERPPGADSDGAPAERGRIPLAAMMNPRASLIALNSDTGAVAWSRPLPASLLKSRNILYLTATGDRLFAVGSHRDDQNDSRYQVVCMETESGGVIWQADHAKGRPGAFSHGEQVHHPVVLGDMLVAEPALYDIATGRRINPDGTDDPWSLQRPGHSCGTLAGAGTCLFFRAGNPTVMDLTPELASQTRTRSLAPNRAGCWINIIPASGLVLIPEASAGCVCQFALQTSMAFLPEPSREDDLSSEASAKAEAPAEP